MTLVESKSRNAASLLCRVIEVKRFVIEVVVQFGDIRESL
jgi:hypothetical protein